MYYSIVSWYIEFAINILLMKQKPQTFYEKSMHSNCNFENHRYFNQSRIKTEQTATTVFKQFVDLPQPFGVNNTYAYLRRANLDKLPNLEPEKKRSFKPRNMESSFSRVSKNLDMSSSLIKINKSTVKKANATIQQEVTHTVRIILYDKMSTIEGIKSRYVELNIMKYYINCFLKCQLKLQRINLDQYRILQDFIPAALQYKHKKNTEYIPRAVLSINQMKSIGDLLSKVQQFRDQDKLAQIYHLLYHFIIPSEEIIQYQMQYLLSEINNLNQFKFQTDYSFYEHLYKMDGTKITNLFSIYSNDHSLICSQSQFQPQEFANFHKILEQEFKQRERNRRQMLMKNRFSDKSETVNIGPKSVKPQNYEKFHLLLEKRKKSKNKCVVKYKNPLLDIKIPFIDKSKLIKQRQIFQ